MASRLTPTQKMATTTQQMMTSLVFVLLPILGNTVTVLKCPDMCDCKYTASDDVMTDCSQRGITEIPPSDTIDKKTVHLDLGGNYIQTVPEGVFDGLGTLSTILLNDNAIRDIERHAFRRVGDVRLVDLRRNQLAELKADSLAGIHGARDCSPTSPCNINLQANPLELVRGYALSWSRGVSLLLGHSNQSLVLEPYVFYGAEDILLIEISSIPSLTLEPRIFTNTDGVQVLRVSDTNVTKIDSFTFEGLSNIEKIHFTSCQFGYIEEFGFSGMLYVPSTRSQRTAHLKNHHRAGGILNISHSTIPVLPPDGFRDTNLEKLVLHGNHISEIRAHAFRGLHSLALLSLTHNYITSIKPNGFSSLNGVPHVRLSQNDLRQLAAFAFTDSKGIQKLTLHARVNSSLMLAAYSFSRLRDVGVLDIKGASGAVFHVDRDAFHDLGDVHTLQISNVSLPIVPKHTFRGLSKIQLIRLEYCNISKIDGAAFSGNSGSVTSLELTAGNNLLCDCQTSELLKNLENRFARFSVSCQISNTSVMVLTPDTLNWPECGMSGASPIQGVVWVWILALSCLLYC